MKTFENYTPAKITAQTHTISVIVAAYNIEDYIERGVESILNQTYRNLEIIIVDDGSTDSTPEKIDNLAKKDSRIVVVHKENSGPADARNKGMNIATGEYYGFVDGDDFIDPDMYEKLLSAMLEFDADMAICRYRRFSDVSGQVVADDSTHRATFFTEQEALECYVREDETFDIMNAAWNKLYRKRLLITFDFPSGKWYEDVMFATQALSRAKRVIYLDTALYNYIIDRAGSIMNTGVNIRTFTDQIPAYKEKTKFLAGLGRADLADIHDYFFYKRLLLFYDELKKSKDKNSKRFMANLYSLAIEDIGDSTTRRFKEIYDCDIVKSSDRKKMKLFLSSPSLYSMAMKFNNAVILPIKTKL